MTTPVAKAAGLTEMEIGKDMTLDYDCKMLSPYRGSHLKDAYLNMIGRLNSKDRAIYDHFYDSLSLDSKSAISVGAP